MIIIHKFLMDNAYNDKIKSIKMDGNGKSIALYIIF